MAIAIHSIGVGQYKSCFEE